MKLLLTSSGISNESIHRALVELLGKPISESTALIIPTAIYPFPEGADRAREAISGEAKSPLAALGWRSLGVLELSVLPSIDHSAWVPQVQQIDALLAWGGDPLFLTYWMQQSGLADLLPSLREETVYVGVSAGAIATAATFGETYRAPRLGLGEAMKSEDLTVATPEGEIHSILLTAQGLGLVDFTIIPHVDYSDPLDVAYATAWARRLAVPAYAIDDETAIKVVGGQVEVVSEGRWQLFRRG